MKPDLISVEGFLTFFQSGRPQESLADISEIYKLLEQSPKSPTSSFTMWVTEARREDHLGSWWLGPAWSPEPLTSVPRSLLSLPAPVMVQLSGTLAAGREKGTTSRRRGWVAEEPRQGVNWFIHLFIHSLNRCLWVLTMCRGCARRWR